MNHYSSVVFMFKEIVGCPEFNPTIVAMNTLIDCFCNLEYMDLGFSVLAIVIKCGLQT